MEVAIAWKIEKQTKTFRIPIRVFNPSTNISIIKYFIFDTGFSGYLALDKKTINQLGLERIGLGKAMTVNGLIEYNSYFGKAEFLDENETKLSPIEETTSSSKTNLIIPIQEFNVNLIGMKSIIQKSWMILHSEILCLLK
ncbi:hypothetical protein DSAG12_01368 [Promethearchaeum syntrophicum]|uniref:Uncharacterized protein n=1 Tax=Promethearchaeum syntrophicum TaxID=2594042 RepID=A0A5B9D8X4_9ARCH|nr:hypothetical protein [Candidatus Prometheoarchaeum syntrophicum]QEE15542.1 hypothetical protein DSAG12_01368 [Candidatus Prometheoarchaeum syntrophicum]